MRINDTSTINLGHHDVHEIIMGCANNFVFGVQRRGEECETENDLELEAAIQTDDVTNGEIHGECNGNTNGEVNGERDILSNGVPNRDINAVGYEPIDEQTLFERIQSPGSQTQSDGSAVTVQSNSVDSISSVVPRRLGPVPYTNGFKKPVENEPDELELQIAEIMSGEAEVLKEHNNIIG